MLESLFYNFVSPKMKLSAFIKSLVKVVELVVAVLSTSEGISSLCVWKKRLLLMFVDDWKAKNMI